MLPFCCVAVVALSFSASLGVIVYAMSGIQIHTTMHVIPLPSSADVQMPSRPEVFAFSPGHAGFHPHTALPSQDLKHTHTT